MPDQGLVVRRVSQNATDVGRLLEFEPPCVTLEAFGKLLSSWWRLERNAAYQRQSLKQPALQLANNL